MTTTETMQAYYLQDGYRGKRGLTGWYRDLTIAEAKRTQGTLYAIDRSGNVRECRTNGAPKTWKTRPGCVLSLKYGLREHFQAGADDREPHEPLSAAHQVRIVVPVNRSFDAETPAGIVADWCLENEIR